MGPRSESGVGVPETVRLRVRVVGSEGRRDPRGTPRALTPSAGTLAVGAPKACGALGGPRRPPPLHCSMAPAPAAVTQFPPRPARDSPRGVQSHGRGTHAPKPVQRRFKWREIPLERILILGGEAWRGMFRTCKGWLRGGRV